MADYTCLEDRYGKLLENRNPISLRAYLKQNVSEMHLKPLFNVAAENNIRVWRIVCEFITFSFIDQNMVELGLVDYPDLEKIKCPVDPMYYNLDVLKVMKLPYDHWIAYWKYLSQIDNVHDIGDQYKIFRRTHALQKNDAEIIIKIYIRSYMEIITAKLFYPMLDKLICEFFNGSEQDRERIFFVMCNELLSEIGSQIDKVNIKFFIWFAEKYNVNVMAGHRILQYELPDELIAYVNTHQAKPVRIQLIGTNNYHVISCMQLELPAHNEYKLDDCYFYFRDFGFEAIKRQFPPGIRDTKITALSTKDDNTVREIILPEIFHQAMAMIKYRPKSARSAEY